MRQQVRRAVMVMAAMVAGGCASARLEVTRPLSTPERRVALRMEAAPESKLSEDQRVRYQSLLTSRLSEKGITVVSSQPDARTTKGQITRYNRGNRALRYFIGFGAGSGALDSQWDVVNQEGQVLGACRIKGSIAMGVFGGDFDDVLEKSGDRLAEFLSGASR